MGSFGGFVPCRNGSVGEFCFAFNLSHWNLNQIDWSWTCPIGSFDCFGTASASLNCSVDFCVTQWVQVGCFGS